MRPSRVETSEPAWTKRKMLSTKSSTSWFFTSRKYSAMVSAASADAEADAGRLVHLAVDEGGLLDDARLLHLEPQVGALAGPLPDAGEHRHAAVLLGHPVDHLLDDDGLADAGPAEQADLAALHVGLEQVDDLDAGLEHLAPGARAGRRPAASRWISQWSSTLADGVGVERLAEHVEHVAEHGVAHRHRDARGRGCAPARRGRSPSVGCMQMQRTRPSPICWATSAVTWWAGPVELDGRTRRRG